jgi:hypothetical protein
MESEWSTKTNRKQRRREGRRQITAAEEQYQADEVASARKRALSQRSIEAVKKLEVLPDSIYSGDYPLQVPINASWSCHTNMIVQTLVAMHEWGIMDFVAHHLLHPCSTPFGRPRVSPLCSPASWTK